VAIAKVQGVVVCKIADELENDAGCWMLDAGCWMLDVWVWESGTKKLIY
jgi:hypothetical protein